MTHPEMLQLFFLCILLVILSPWYGKYIATVYQSTASLRLGWLEQGCYQICNIDPEEEMSWKEYAKALLLFNFLGFLVLFFLQLFQYYLPLNPQKLPGVSWHLAFNTAASFATNTNWQAYSGESTLSYFTQMAGLCVQNFLSAATGLAAFIVLVRGFLRKTSQTIGNFWQDLVRAIVYIFLPLSILLAIFLLTQGVVQSFSPYVEAKTLEGSKQLLPLGPAASQIAIKQLGTNGGGFFGVNSAHPFENPTALSNFLELFAILFIPIALVFTFGQMIEQKQHGWLLFAVMAILFGIGLALSLFFEQLKSPILPIQPYLEGKETRFGIFQSVLWAVSTTATANGSVNSMISSMSPITGAVCMFNIMVGELIFGGVGVGMCSMIMFVLLTVFLAGLMVGRTPEYLGKKIEWRDIQWVIIAVLMPGALILIGSGISSVLEIGVASCANKGPHGLSEILYAFSSGTGNNGSAFAGLQVNTVYYNVFLGCIMLIARCAIIIPSIAIAGQLAKKKIVPASVGTFSTNTVLFACLLIFSILIIGALTYSPAQILGPIVEQFLLLRGQTF